MNSQNAPDDIRPFDILVIGGGINGAGIACDASGRGLTVALCEQGDLAGATSSASTKMIHGGLRYLEFFEFRLVREALREREIMLSKAPHLIRVMCFVLPHQHQARPAWMVRLGLFLYDHLARHPRLPNSKGINLRHDPLGAPLQAGLNKGFVYSDCWVDDARLVVANARSAAAAGAEIRVRTKLITAERRDGLWLASLRDESSGEIHQIWARALVNAAGPWVQQVLQGALAINRTNAVVLVKGSHIVVPKLYHGPQAFLLQNPDNRVVFVIPYEGDFSLIGTTEVAVEGDPANPRIDEKETQYLCDSVNRYFQNRIAPQDVVWTYSGIRPLFNDGVEDISEVSRGYVLDLNAADGLAPLLSVFGGKITTYRRLAEQVMADLQPFFKNMGPPWTATAKLPGGNIVGENFETYAEALAGDYPGLDPQYLTMLARRHGTDSHQILGPAKIPSDLGIAFGGGLYQCEVDYLIETEWARSGEDILWRRTKTGLHMTAAERAAVSNYVAAQY